jgi:hypothetical protein
MTLFDILKSITETKQDLSDHPDFEKTYSKFMVNRFLACAPDLVSLVNTINTNNKCSNKQHYYFFVTTVFKKRRYLKYAKKEAPIQHLEAVRKYFNTSEEKALEYLSLLNKEQIKNIVKSFSHGMKP